MEIHLGNVLYILEILNNIKRFDYTYYNYNDSQSKLTFYLYSKYLIIKLTITD